MSRPVSPSSELAHALYVTRNELETYAPSPTRRGVAKLSPQLEMGEWRALCELPSYEYSHHIYALFELANGIAEYGTYNDEPPQLAITQAAVAMAAVANRATSLNEITKKACFQAEMRVVRSLDAPGKSAPPGARQRPAKLIFDIHGEPFAYRKCSGTDIAYAWRDGTIDTGEGPQWVPASSFFETVRSSYPDDPRPFDIGFLRFSTHHLHPAIAAAAHKYIADYPPDGGNEALFADTERLGENLAETLRLGPEDIGRRACALLNTQVPRAHQAAAPALQ